MHQLCESGEVFECGVVLGWILGEGEENTILFSRRELKKLKEILIDTNYHISAEFENNCEFLSDKYFGHSKFIIPDELAEIVYKKICEDVTEINNIYNYSLIFSNFSRK